MCFKSSRRLLSLSSTIVFLDHISAIYVVFLEISICFLLQVLFLYCLATSGGRFSAPLSCHVWKSWHTYRVSSVYYYIRSFFRIGFFLRSLFSKNISESKVAGSSCNIEITNHQVASSTLPKILLLSYLIYNFNKRVN